MGGVVLECAAERSGRSGSLDWGGGSWDRASDRGACGWLEGDGTGARVVSCGVRDWLGDRRDCLGVGLFDPSGFCWRPGGAGTMEPRCCRSLGECPSGYWSNRELAEGIGILV